MDRSNVTHFCAAFATTQNRFDARHQLARIKRLGQVVIRAKLQTEDLIDIFVTGGEHENSSRVLRGAQATADFEAIQFWEHYIQHHQSRLKACHFFQCDLSIVRRLNAKPVALEIHARQLDDGWLVIDEEDEFVGHNQCSVLNCASAMLGLDTSETLRALALLDQHSSARKA